MRSFASSLRLLRTLSLCLGLGGSALLQAQSYSAGEQKYQNGDLVGAKNALKDALRKTKNRDESAKILKLLGICQFMLGEKKDASFSFRSALKLTPTLQIKPSEVLDEAVIPFFNAERRPQASQVAKKPSAKAKETSLVITSNAKDASIMIDGILVGNVGGKLEVEGGLLQIGLQAKGFKSKTFRVRVNKNQENLVTLNLDKIEKIEKVEKPPKQAAPSVELVASQRPSKAMSQRPASQKAAKKPKRSKTPLPKASANLFSEPEPSLTQETGGRDLTREFAAETSRPPTYVAPPPTYQPQPYQPYSYPYGPVQMQPGYPMQPTYPMQPAYPNYGAPPYGPSYSAPSYAPPPYSPPSYAPPAYSAPPAPQTAEPPPPAPDYYNDAPAPKKKRKADKTSDKPGHGSTFVALLPFGAGQFQNGQTFWGLAFAAAELGALYGAYYFDGVAAEAANNRKKVTEGTGYTEAQREEYSRRSKSEEANADNQRNLSLLGFGLLWAGGSFHAIVSMPDDKPLKKKRYSLMEDEAPQESEERLTSKGLDQQFQVGLLWPKQTEPHLALTYQLRF